MPDFMTLLLTLYGLLSFAFAAATWQIARVNGSDHGTRFMSGVMAAVTWPYFVLDAGIKAIAGRDAGGE